MQGVVNEHARASQQAAAAVLKRPADGQGGERPDKTPKLHALDEYEHNELDMMAMEVEVRGGGG